MGMALKEQGDLNGSIASYKKALAIKSDYTLAYYNLSFPCNLKGDLENGLKLYEWRLKKKKPKARTPRENLIWDGKKSVSGKKFFVYEEQGPWRCYPVL